MRRFMVQRAVELAGLFLLAFIGASVLALMTWSVEDPSLTHATDGRVANMLGMPGAIFADLIMQIFGLGSVALLLPCAVWAIRLVGRRPLPRPALRIGLWLVGTGAASAVASALPETARWPLPSGLGGVVGDALLFGGHGLAGTGGIGGVIVGLFYAATAILALSAASGFGLAQAARSPSPESPYEMPAADDDGRDEPGWGIVSLGAVIHGLMTLRTALARRFRKPDPLRDGREPAEGLAAHPAREPVFGDDYDFAESYATHQPQAVHQAPAQNFPQGYPQAAPAFTGDGSIEAAGDIPPEIAAFAPTRGRPSRVHMPAAPVPAAVLPQPPEPIAAPPSFDAPLGAPEGAVSADGTPAWRKPFQLPPNVRFTRSTDRELAARQRVATDGMMAGEMTADSLAADNAAHDFAPADEAAFAGYPEDRREADAFAPFAGEADAGEEHADDRWAEDAQASVDPHDDDIADIDAAEEHDSASLDAEFAAGHEAPPVFLRHTARPSALAPSNDDDPYAPPPPVVARPAPRPAGEGAGRPLQPRVNAAAVGATAGAAMVRTAAAAPTRAPSAGVTTRRVPQAVAPSGEYQMPPLSVLAIPAGPKDTISEDALEQNAALLESTLEDFGVRGDIIHVRPGPVVTLYELEPAPGTKSSRVISLADDIARSMSAVSARVAVVAGRNAIGIELPNARRETVFLRELLASEEFQRSKFKLALCLGKTIGGEPVIADLARMPHLLVAGTTGSGKSVAINTMIMSLLYRLRPEECRLIMVDPKMLELSVYDGIPHLLTPVVTDPKKAVVALKWAVREMEERYKKMSKLSVRNIDGFNTRVRDAKARGEVITRTVQVGFDKDTGEAIYEDEVMDLDPLPYIVIVVDEMADLMMVAGKEIEGTIQRLAQMARAAGIHVILATQRPSVDVITGTIKANFPTRISFQVTSKIDSRTILGEQGAEQLLGQGDMLYMAGGGRVVRVHGPFVSDDEVEKIVAHLKTQGRPQYLEAVTADEEAVAESDGSAVFDNTANGAGGGNDLYDQAIAIVLRDKKASTSYIQRRLQIGYNRAASIMERMELEGIVGPANHAGKREILLGGEDPTEQG
ncbi:DNA segregation ATPase FtsK/SpoIIIE-like protein [Pseudochelatococcus lubricantis]|uniref:DNA translocase FtsK n=1 Tax=Pseudochelatococcus lubricantis TaxID=1538102 RepID=A0ABX0V426_9HYPH|nr:DNA translocase FtsK [Pseudochelatococcus lubricantis]NIJ58555.1 DNA segregation ATPase FtsK/SpoIIIE-like protein [Pseudochelatococcus lubricantis]